MVKHFAVSYTLCFVSGHRVEYESDETCDNRSFVCEELQTSSEKFDASAYFSWTNQPIRAAQNLLHLMQIHLRLVLDSPWVPE
jgi:hypothetical protein